jgi:hypothetical protein
LNGLPIVPAPGTTAALPVAATGPDMTASAYARCAGAISFNGVSLKRRMSSCAHALPASKAGKQQSNCPDFHLSFSLEVTRQSSIRNNQSPLLSPSGSPARVKKGGVLVTNSAQVVPARRVRYHGCHQPSWGIAMTTLEVKLKLPDSLASRAQAAGLLNSEAIGKLLADALRSNAFDEFLSTAEPVAAAGVAPLSPEEIEAEIKVYRAERRSK